MKAVFVVTISLLLLATSFFMNTLTTSKGHTQEPIIEEAGEKLILSTAMDDLDGNNFIDIYENLLCFKFCPSLILNKREEDTWNIAVCPEPVEIINQEIWLLCHLPPVYYVGEQYRTVSEFIDIYGDYAWIDNSQDYNYGGPATFVNCPSIGPTNYLATYHFEYGGISGDCDALGGSRNLPNGWYETYREGNEHVEPGAHYPHTVYAHPYYDYNAEKHVIQYWYFYPFNNWVNNHEGDWEHINVIISSDDPETAVVTEVVYYFHEECVVCYDTQVESPSQFDCYIMDESHPVIFVGGWGENEALGEYGAGEASHASYPVHGLWENVSEVVWENPVQDQILFTPNDYIDSDGKFIPWWEFVAATDGNKYGIVLLKEPSCYYGNREMDWLSADIFWGHFRVRSMGTENPWWTVHEGNTAPCGPYYKGWNTYAHGGIYNYYDEPRTYAYASDAEWEPPVVTPEIESGYFININEGEIVTHTLNVTGTVYEDSVYIDWKNELIHPEWNTQGIEMHYTHGPFAAWAYFTIDTQYIPAGTVILRGRSYNEDVLVYENEITIYVEHMSVYVALDGSSTVTSIQEGIDIVSHGDSVIVRGPGTYIENITLKGGMFLITRDSGTIIMGDGTPADETGYGPVISINDESYSTTIEGFSIRHCEDTRNDVARGIKVHDSDLIIRNCTIEQNTSKYGAGVFIEGYSDVKFENCSIINNMSFSDDFGAFNWCGASAIQVRGHLGPAYPAGSPVVTLDNCLIEGNLVDGVDMIVGFPQASVIAFDYGSVFPPDPDHQSPLLQHCEIKNNNSYHSTLSYYSCTSPPRIEHSLISDNSHSVSSNSVIFCDSDLQVEHSTLVNNYKDNGDELPVLYFSTQAMGSEISNCIIAQNEGPAISPHAIVNDVTVLNTLLFDNDTDGSLGPQDHEWLSYGINVLNEDPYFCNNELGDYLLYAHSPCSPLASDCGLIGAHNVHCMPGIDTIYVLNEQVLVCPSGCINGIEVYIDFNDNDMGRDINSTEVNMTIINGADLHICNEETCVATTPLNSSNGWASIIEQNYLSGCGDKYLELSLGLMPVETLLVNIKSPDLNNSGEVNLSDIGIFGLSYNHINSDPEYDDCCDFNWDTNCNLSDFVIFGQHIGDSCPASNPPAMVSPPTVNDMFVVFDVSEDSEYIYVTVKLKNVHDISIIGMALDDENNGIVFDTWIPDPSFPQLSDACSTINRGRQIVFIAAFGGTILNNGEYTMGMLRYKKELPNNIQAQAMTLNEKREFRLEFGSVLNINNREENIRVDESEAPIIALPQADYLSNCYPNPFNPTTTIEYGIATDSQVTFSIYNVAGQLVKTLVNEHQKANYYSVIWDGTNNTQKSVASGIYFYKLQTTNYSKTKKMVLLR